MNYIRELNAFYDWLETNPLPLSAFALWHALMHIANKAAWADDFAVAISVLCAKTGMEKKTVERARNILQQKGVIFWEKRSGRQSATYRMLSLCDIYTPQTVSQDVPLEAKCDKNTPQSVPQHVAQSVPQSVAINKRKLNETKPKIKDEKITRAEFVSLTNDEYSSLVAKLGSEELLHRCIEVLDNYKGASGKKYASDYRAILNWVIDRVTKENGGVADGNTSRTEGQTKKQVDYADSYKGW